MRTAGITCTHKFSASIAKVVMFEGVSTFVAIGDSEDNEDNGDGGGEFCEITTSEGELYETSDEDA